MLLQSEALERATVELADPELLRKFQDAFGAVRRVLEEMF